MYNRYIPNGASYTRVAVEEREPEPRAVPGAPAHQEERTPPPSQEEHAEGRKSPGQTGPNRQSRAAGVNWIPAGGDGNDRGGVKLGGFTIPPFLLGGEEKGALTGLLRSLKLENLDSGDILLLLIILFLLLEGDNLELVIALGLVLIMGLGDEEKEKQK